MTDKIKARIEKIIEDLILFDNDLDKYEYIVDLGKALKPLEESFKLDAFLVEGCMSKVWLIPKLENGNIFFSADSDSVIVKGLISILIKIFNDSIPEDILTTDINELQALKLNEIISPSRQNGVYHMISKIKFYAQGYWNKNEVNE